MKKLMVIILLPVLLASSVCALAEDVWVDPHYRDDGTYVRGYYKSSPDGLKWNNYGPSMNSWQLTNPRSRDWDGNGIPNFRDLDDDNDGLMDDVDDNQYGQ